MAIYNILQIDFPDLVIIVLKNNYIFFFFSEFERWKTSKTRESNPAKTATTNTTYNPDRMRLYYILMNAVELGLQL